ncbi:hypothetical protein BCR44DRAFT_1438320 [Catenaria anguillulae PL171]|uniref:Secreted protein n=1 Tax=Catenaria anguillulae PL171 TaxID=765915 RepID=A0A1Y2HFP3_9FUNG|nr:hypothetical protein BCR44DRAFT_1438320 [Catenaria anguillulae PL171]
MTICWILFILFMVNENDLLPVRGQAVRSLCACLVFAAESMFEPIFNKSKALTRTLKRGGGGQGVAVPESQVGGFTLKTMVVSEVS